MHARKTHVKRGFTLIEILIVVVILGILAAIIVPQFTNAAQDANVSSAKSQLQTMRSQIELFRVQNGGTAPANLDELVTDGYIRTVPTWPDGFAATYTAATGVLTLSYDGTVDFNGDGDASNDNGATGW